MGVAMVVVPAPVPVMEGVARLRERALGLGEVGVVGPIISGGTARLVAVSRRSECSGFGSPQIAAGSSSQSW